MDYAKSPGAFDYSFTEKPADMSTFEFGYTDYVRDDGYKGGTLIPLLITMGN